MSVRGDPRGSEGGDFWGFLLGLLGHREISEKKTCFALFSQPEGSMGEPWGVLGEPLRGPGGLGGGTCGSQGGSWVSLGGSWGALGSPCGDLGVPWGGPRGSLGALGDPFWGYWAIEKSLKNLVFYCVFATWRILGIIRELQGGPREPKGRPRVAQGGPKGDQGVPVGVQGGPGGAEEVASSPLWNSSVRERVFSSSRVFIIGPSRNH